jgi:threonine dehydratase
MARSIAAGEIISEEMVETFSDGTAGGIEPGAITFDICRALVDDFILVEEKKIAQALTWFLSHHHMLIEGAAALPVAALMQDVKRFAKRRTILILSGANIGVDRLKILLKAGEVSPDRIVI